LGAEARDLQLLLEPAVGRALVDGQWDVAHLAQPVGDKRDAVRLELALDDLAALVLDLVSVGISHLSVPLGLEQPYTEPTRRRRSSWLAQRSSASSNDTRPAFTSPARDMSIVCMP